MKGAEEDKLSVKMFSELIGSLSGRDSTPKSAIV